MGKRFDRQLQSTTAGNNNYARLKKLVVPEILAMEERGMKPIRLVGIGAMVLLLGAAAPTYAQQDQEAKPEQHEHQTKPKKQPTAKPAKQEKQPAKGQQKQQQQHARTQPAQEKSQQHQQEQASGQQHGLPQGQWAHSGQKITVATSTVRLGLDRIIMPASKRMAVATTTAVASTLTADTGSMLDPTRRGSTSRTCTSLWERMAYGMQLPTATLP